MKLIRQIIKEELDLQFAILTEKERTIQKDTGRYSRVFSILDLHNYLEVNSDMFSKFTFINKGENDERTTGN